MNNSQSEADLLRENAELRASDAQLREVLGRIGRWFGEFPSSKRFWDEDMTQPMSYAAAFGSNGERDYMRELARKAIAKSPARSLAAIIAPLEARIAEMQGVLELAEPYCCGTALMLIRKLLNAKGISTMAGEEIESPAKLLEDHEKAHAIFVRYSARTVRALLGSENQSLKNRSAQSLAAIQDAYWKRLHAAMMQLVTLRGINSRSAIADFVLDLEKLPDYLEDAGQMARRSNNGKTWQEEIRDAARVEEREACAAQVESFSDFAHDQYFSRGDVKWVLGLAAKAIRRRGNGGEDACKPY